MSAVLSIEEGATAQAHPDGARILRDTDAFIRRFCVLPSDADHIAVTLWAAHAHMVEHFHTTPRLAFLSPEPGSGKTRVLEVLDLLVPLPMFVFSASVAAIFRTMADNNVTLLFDEVDAIFGKRGKDDHNEDLRALLNAGYKRGATIPRCVGARHEVIRFDVFAPVALAGLGDLPDTIMTRSIIIRMRRRAPTERVEPFRHREHEHIGHGIRDRLAAWAETVGADAGAAWPKLPAGVEDRAAEVWEPLIAVADAAGGDWPQRARSACSAICATGESRGQSLGVRLLMDLRRVFGDADALSTATIIEVLTGKAPVGRDADGDAIFLTDAPWSDLHGKPIDSRMLARMLGKYNVKADKVRESGTSRPLQGYRRTALWDTWERYAPLPASPEHPEQTAHDQRLPCSTRSGHLELAELGKSQSNADRSTCSTSANLGASAVEAIEL